MFLGFVGNTTLYVIAHIFGAILGAGSAFLSDAMFFSSVKDGLIEKTELRFMQLGGMFVWIGVFILVVSGVFLVSTNPSYYLSSAKFLAKISIVGLIITNGIIFHFVHLPNIKKHLGIKFIDAPLFIKNSSFLMASGALSMVSWIFTVVLGMLKNVPYSYMQIMSVYLTCIILAVTFALLSKKKILKI